MTNNPIVPPREKKKKTKPSSSSSPSFSSVPDDVIVNILARISKSHYLSLSLVSKNFYTLLSSPDIYLARSLLGNTDARLYVCLWLPTPSSSHDSWFTLGSRQGRLSLVPVRVLSSSYSPDRLNSTTVAVHSEIYQMGGSNEAKRSRAVRVLDCRNHTWRRRVPDMKVARKHARSYYLDDKIYVMGGCTKTESWGEVFDLKTQTWKPLPKPPCSYENEIVFGGRLYVFTINNNKKYAYDPKEERWVQESGFVGLERIITGPWCVIGNEIYGELDGNYTWYNPRNGKQIMVHGLKDLYAKRASNYRTIQLVNHGGKLVILWDEWNRTHRDHRSVWCAVISLEERLTPLGIRMCGKVERCKVVLDSVHKSYKFSSCHSVSV